MSAHGVSSLQLAGGDAVVISWITFEASNATFPPEVQWSAGAGPVAASGATSTKGATHIHMTAARDRRYHFHFVKLAGLKPRAQYSYKVRPLPINVDCVPNRMARIISDRDKTRARCTKWP